MTGNTANLDNDATSPRNNLTNSRFKGTSKEPTVEPLENTYVLSFTYISFTGTTKFKVVTPPHEHVTVVPITEELTIKPSMKSEQWGSDTLSTGLHVTDVGGHRGQTPESNRQYMSQTTTASIGRDVLGTEAEFRTNAYTPTATLEIVTSAAFTCIHDITNTHHFIRLLYILFYIT